MVAPPLNPPDFSVHRLKGRVLTVSGGVKMIQGVRDVFDMVDLDESAPNQQDETGRREGKLVLIGRGFSDLPVEESLLGSLG